MGTLDEERISESIKNFDYLDELIHAGANEIVLDSDIILSDGEESKYSEGIYLDRDNLIIDGNGHLIDAKGLTRIFFCVGKNIIIKGIELKNGFAEENGGSIFIDKGELVIRQSTICKSTSKYGGAIYNNEGEISIMESALNENVARSNGGAIHNYKGKLMIFESTFSANNANQGGAIHNYRAELNIGKTALIENRAKDFGGAIFSNGDYLLIENSILNENIANIGGAIYNNNGELNIMESSLKENMANIGGAINNLAMLKIRDSTLKLNKTKEHGGAIHNFDGEVSIESSLIIKNTSKTHGGGIFTNNSIDKLIDSVIEENEVDNIYEIKSMK